LLFENSKAIADFDTKAVSKIDQKWWILTRRRPEPWLVGPARADSESLVAFFLPRQPSFLPGGGASFAPLLNESNFSPKVFGQSA
jgi:hypothetical protein